MTNLKHLLLIGSVLILTFPWMIITPGCRKSFMAVHDSAYAIGVVDTYNSSSNNGNIYFHFTALGKTNYSGYPDGEHGWNIPSNAHIEIGYMYMVQFDTLSPSDARMMFCYRVHDSTDYNNYVAQFNITPPGCH